MLSVMNKALQLSLIGFYVRKNISLPLSPDWNKEKNYYFLDLILGELEVIITTLNLGFGAFS